MKILLFLLLSLPSISIAAPGGPCDALSKFRSRGISNGKDFREQKQTVSNVLTLRIKRFFFEKILTGEKSFEYRIQNETNNALIESAVRRQAKFLRLHFQDNDIQLLASIVSIDVVSGEEASEPWDLEQGIGPSSSPHWRIAIQNPKLIWKNPKSIEVARTLNLKNPF